MASVRLREGEKSFNIRIAFKPVKILGHIFKQPKDSQNNGKPDWIGVIVYKKQNKKRAQWLTTHIRALRVFRR